MLKKKKKECNSSYPVGRCHKVSLKKELFITVPPGGK